MAEVVTTGTWNVDGSKATAFIESWTAFAAWASETPGANTLRLGRDVGDPTRFVSYAAWHDAASVRAWKAGPEFRERLAHVLQHVEDFQAAELDVVVACAAPTTEARRLRAKGA